MVIERARRRFLEVFHAPAAGAVFAPGRVNLVGEHTDYNDGFVLPMAIDRGLALAFAPRTDDELRVHSADVPQTRDLRLAQLRPRVSAEPDRRGPRGVPAARSWRGGVEHGVPAARSWRGGVEHGVPAARSWRGGVEHGGWFGYVAGVAWALLGAGIPIRGADVAIAGDLPMGAGLSSSAALEVGMARTLVAASGLEWDPKAAALLAQRAEQEFAGVACGIMDQLAVACAREGCALFIDCRSLDTHDVPLPDGMSVLIFDSGIRRDLASTAYNERRASCERAVKAIRSRHPEVTALRDADRPMLEEAKPTIGAEDYLRARHVLAENPRPHAMSAALAVGDLARAGRVMVESHASLRNLFDVSMRELDVLVEAATSQPRCYGARLTGAGFGGCVVAIADTAATETTIGSVSERYRTLCGRETRAFVCRASAGARLVSVAGAVSAEAL